MLLVVLSFIHRLSQEVTLPTSASMDLISPILSAVKAIHGKIKDKEQADAAILDISESVDRLGEFVELHEVSSGQSVFGLITGLRFARPRSQMRKPTGTRSRPCSTSSKR